MILSLAFVPPAAVLDHVVSNIDLRRASVDGLDVVPKSELHMSMTTFGNVSRGGVPQLVEAVSRASENWLPAPTVHLAGGAALEWPGDTSVWATTKGDVEPMNHVARSIAPAVDRLGFAVDRRRFHPWLPIARVTASTELSLLEQLLAQLDAYSGPEWVVSHLSLLRATFASDRASARGFETLREFPLPSS
jgi:2'-5' RNA ligase